MQANNTALILIGYQNDYFAPDGILRAVIEESAQTNNVLDNTLRLLDNLAPGSMPLIHTPIVFTSDYSELREPVGILRAVRDHKAFREGSPGCASIDDIKRFGSRIREVKGKRGLNAFSNTQLDQLLQELNVKHIVLAGAVTSICIDSTGRAAAEKGYKVSILSDCTCGRTNMEQEFFCTDIFPLYASVIDSGQLVAAVGQA